MQNLFTDIENQISLWRSAMRGEMAAEGLDVLQGRLTIPIQELRTGVVLGPNDRVVVAGSLIEGLGNEFSDIDIHIICERRPQLWEFPEGIQHRLLSPDRRLLRHGINGARDEEVFLAHSPVAGTAIKIDVEYNTDEEFCEMLTSIEELFDYARVNLVLLTRDLPYRLKVLIHRIATGIALGDSNQPVLSEQIKTKFRYLQYRWFASDFMMLLDCMGAWRQGDLLRAVDIARESLIQQAIAFNALLGCLNATRKWVPVYLARFYMGPSNLVSEFLRLYTGVKSREPAEMDQYIRDAFDLIDLFYDEGRELLAKIPGIPTGDEAVDLLKVDRDLCLNETPYATMEFAYRARAYRPESLRSIELVNIVEGAR